MSTNNEASVTYNLEAIMNKHGNMDNDNESYGDIRKKSSLI